uniref:Uncharacterized protein n=1 Tax=Bracon brevicornis TaxID=1563983 RepID=A0A6V7JQF6_9HYME
MSSTRKFRTRNFFDSEVPPPRPPSPNSELKDAFASLDLVSDSKKRKYNRDAVMTYKELPTNIDVTMEQYDSATKIFSQNCMESIRQAALADYEHVLQQSRLIKPEEISGLNEEQLREMVHKLLEQGERVKTALFRSKHFMKEHFLYLERYHKELKDIQTRNETKFFDAHATVTEWKEQYKKFQAERKTFEVRKAKLEKDKAYFKTKWGADGNLEKRINKLSKDLESCQRELSSARLKLAILEEKAEENELLEQQVQVYKDEIAEEAKAKEALLLERDGLTRQLGNLRAYNMQLLLKMKSTAAASNQPRTTTDGILVDACCDVCGLHKMPGKSHGPGICKPKM